jgi:hypothetical protein
MKYQVGDTVILLHSNEEGTIVDFLNQEMAIVDVKGVQFPVYFDQIDFPYFKRFTEKKKPEPIKRKKHVDDLRKEKKPERADRKSGEGVLLSFLPDLDQDEFGDEYVKRLRLYLVNQSETPFRFEYFLRYFGKTDITFKNELPPHSDFYLHDIDFENLNDSPSFDFIFSHLEKKPGKADFFEASVRLKPKQLFARIDEIRRENKASFSQALFREYPDEVPDHPVEMGRLAQSGGKLYDASRAREHLEPARSVVDLHADKLAERPGRLKPHEIFSLQMKTFEKYYQLAVVHMQPSLVIIHGVGEGRLRDEIHDRLKRKKEVSSFVNQYHPSFGYGATEIFLQY